MATEPYAITGNNLFDKLLARILGALIPGGEGLAGLASPFAKKLFGIHNTPILNTVLATNMTPYGVQLASDSGLIQDIASSALRGTKDAAQYGTMQQLARIMTSYEAWTRLQPGEQAGSYEAFIAKKAQEYVDNPALSLGYTVTDPHGMQELNKYMGMAATNMIRTGLQRGDRNAYIKARSVVGDMFRDDAGNYEFNKEDWGYFNNGEVAQLTAAITKNIDVIGDAGTDPASLKNATQRLRDTVKKYADALSPLKDLFGSDVPAMIKSIEELAGQDIAQMGVDRAKSIAHMVTDRTSTGKYSMQELSAWSGQFSAAMGQMDVPTLNKLNGTMYAAFALDAANGGIRPKYMTSQDFIKKTADRVLRTANSEGADDYDKAFALWAENERRKGTAVNEINAETFYRELNALAADKRYGGDTAAAMLELAGVNNRYELNMGKSLEYYKEAKASGVGALAAFDTQLTRDLTAGKYAMLNDTGIRNSISKYAGADNYTVEQMGEDFDKTIEILKETPDLLNMSGDQRTLELARKLDPNAKISWADYSKNLAEMKKEGKTLTVADYMVRNGVSGEDSDRIKRYQHISNTLIADKTYQAIYTGLFARYNQNRQAMAAAKAASRRDYVTNLGHKVGSVKENLLELFKNMHDETQLKNAITEIVNVAGGSEEVRAETAATIEAAARFGDSQYSLADDSYVFKEGGVFSKDSNTYKSWKAKWEKDNQPGLENELTEDERLKLEDQSITEEEMKRIKNNAAYRLFKKERQQENRTRIYNTIRDSVAYTNSAEGLSNVGYRNMLIQYMKAAEAGDAAEQKLYASMMQVYRFVNPDAVSEFLDKGIDDTDPGYTEWKNTHEKGTIAEYIEANPEAAKKAVMGKLVDALNRGGASGARAFIENTKITNTLADFVAKGDNEQKAVRKVLHDAFIVKGKDAGFAGDIGTFDESKFQKWIEDKKKEIKNNKTLDEDGKSKQLAAVDALAADITRARTGMTAQPRSIEDILNIISTSVKRIADKIAPSTSGG